MNRTTLHVEALYRSRETGQAPELTNAARTLLATADLVFARDTMSQRAALLFGGRLACQLLAGELPLESHLEIEAVTDVLIIEFDADRPAEYLQLVGIVDAVKGDHEGELVPWPRQTGGGHGA